MFIVILCNKKSAEQAEVSNVRENYHLKRCFSRFCRRLRSKTFFSPSKWHIIHTCLYKLWQVSYLILTKTNKRRQPWNSVHCTSFLNDSIYHMGLRLKWVSNNIKTVRYTVTYKYIIQCWIYIFRLCRTQIVALYFRLCLMYVYILFKWLRHARWISFLLKRKA